MTEDFPYTKELKKLNDVIEMIIDMTKDSYTTTLNAIDEIISENLISSQVIAIFVGQLFKSFVKKQPIYAKLEKEIFIKYNLNPKDYESSIPSQLKESLVFNLVLHRETPKDLIFKPRRGTIEYILKNDLSEELKALKKPKSFAWNSKVGRDLCYLDFCARIGSVNCFKILLDVDGPGIEARTLGLAFLSKNDEIINMCLNKVQPTKELMFSFSLSHNNSLSEMLVKKYRIAPMFNELARAINIHLILEKMNRVKNVDFIDKAGNTVLYCCAQFGLTYLVQYFIEHGADVNIPVKSGDFPLFAAISNNFYDTALLLVEKGANVKAVTSGNISVSYLAVHDSKFLEFVLNRGAPLEIATKEEHQTPIFVALQANNLESLKILIRKGANVNHKDIAKNTPLHVAVIDHCDMEIIKTLVENNAYINERNMEGNTPLLEAVSKEYTDAAVYLLKKGANPNSPNKGQQSPLLLAVFRRNMTLISQLVKHKADINYQPCAPILAALLRNDVEIVKYLIEQKCRLDFVDHHGIAPIIAAFVSGNRDFINMILDRLPRIVCYRYAVISYLSLPIVMNDMDLFMKMLKKCDVNQLGEYFGTALNAAAQYNFTKFAEILIENGADVNLEDENGYSPLFHACRNDSVDVLRLLLDKGANMNAKIEDNMSALHYCGLMNSCKCIELLIERGANIEARSDKNMSVLAHCSVSKALGALKILLRHGANINVLNDYKGTPLLHALIENDTKYCCYMLKHGASVEIYTIDDVTPKLYIDRFMNKDILKCMFKYQNEGMKKLLGREYNKYYNIVKDYETTADVSDDDMGPEPQTPEIVDFKSMAKSFNEIIEYM